MLIQSHTLVTPPPRKKKKETGFKLFSHFIAPHVLSSSERRGEERRGKEEKKCQREEALGCRQTLTQLCLQPVHTRHTRHTVKLSRNKPYRHPLSRLSHFISAAAAAAATGLEYLNRVAKQQMEERYKDEGKEEHVQFPVVGWRRRQATCTTIGN